MSVSASGMLGSLPGIPRIPGKKIAPRVDAAGLQAAVSARKARNPWAGVFVDVNNFRLSQRTSEFVYRLGVLEPPAPAPAAPCDEDASDGPRGTRAPETAASLQVEQTLGVRTGGVVWSAALVLSAFLEWSHQGPDVTSNSGSRAADFSLQQLPPPRLLGARVLELGCGTGLVGMVSCTVLLTESAVRCLFFVPSRSCMI